MSSQWDNFLKNLGTWHGSFATMNLDGDISEEVPSILSLDFKDGDRQTVDFTLRRFGNGGYESEPTSSMATELTSLGRHTIFFETGAFSKGSMCLSSISPFIAEFGFIVGDRRLRMVQIYGDDFKFDQLVFIREFRADSETKERPPLTVEQLLGTWESEYHTYTPDFEAPKVNHSRIVLRKDGDFLHCDFELENKKLTAKAEIQGNKIRFLEGGLHREITLLPDGASFNVPPQLEQKKPFFVEAGWLVSDNVRQRIMRNFNAQGEWVSSTLIFEKRVS